MLENYCFANTAIERLVLRFSAPSIGIGVFLRCENLQSVDFRHVRSLKKLEAATFHECRRLRTVLLGDRLETIGCGCFSHSGLEEVVLPKSIKCIENDAFGHCKRLKRVVVTGEKLESIGAQAFAYSGLESFVAPASLRVLEEGVFSHCPMLKHVDFGVCTL